MSSQLPGASFQVLEKFARILLLEAGSSKL